MKNYNPLDAKLALFHRMDTRLHQMKKYFFSDCIKTGYLEEMKNLEEKINLINEEIKALRGLK